MRGDNKFTAFASGNGDTSLIEAHNKTIQTDIHYRQDGAEDEDNKDIPDFAPDIRAACPDNHMHLFVLTHDDKDHLGGADAIFHLDAPATWNPRPRFGEPKILIDEIWCSPHAVKQNDPTDAARPMIDEIKRRYALRDTPAANQDGNRLVVMTTKTHHSGTFAPGITWRLLAPNSEEADVQNAPSDTDSPNCTSLVIRWTVTVNGGDNHIFLGGDTTVEVLERLEREVHRKSPNDMAWHILLAIHHCSRRSIGRVLNDGHKDEEFEQSDQALKALSEQRGDGFVVSSSKRIVRGAQTPPSYHAKLRYLKTLARGKDPAQKDRDRFLCTGGNEEGDKPEHLVFHLTGVGPTKPQRTKHRTTVGAAVASSVGRGGGYGRNG